MARTAIFPAMSLMVALAACGPAPEEEGDVALMAQVAPDPEGTQQVAEEATAASPAMTETTAPSAPEPEPRPGRRRAPERGDQTRLELEQRMLAGFDRLDMDGDGQLTPDEQAAGEGRGGARMLRRADADGDGTLTRDEVRQAAGTFFDMTDADGDGVLTEAERPRRDR